MKTPAEQILEALTVALELTATDWQAATKAAVVKKLLAYDLAAVLTAIDRCTSEWAGKLTLAAIVQRIDNGLPSADEAFGLLLRGLCDETLTVVIPKIAQEAMNNGAQALLDAGDKTGARMAFKEAYSRLAANTQGKAEWTVSLGTDAEHRRRAIAEAKGKLPETALLDYAPQNALPKPCDVDNAKNRQRISKILLQLAEKKDLRKANQHAEFEAKRAQMVRAARVKNAA
ncbi:hypothetical protein [Kingella negevensis]|uniref:hypothetical protein n=1 Tax=Kingella negevensis TaxID=1522312 RepID=UPI0006944C37|nr:hypothetical protein [Kingella negevensis]